MRPGKQHFHMHHNPSDEPDRGEHRPRPGGRGGRGGPRGPHFDAEGGPPWAGRRMRRGDIRTAVLTSLQDGPGHGYELMGRMAERTGGRWRPSPGSVYPTLAALQDEGLVTSVETDGKRVFSLTEAGQTAAAERAESRGPSWMAGSDEDQKLRASMMQLMAAAKQVDMTASPELITQADAIVTEARRKLYQLLAEA